MRVIFESSIEWATIHYEVIPSASLFNTNNSWFSLSLDESECVGNVSTYYEISTLGAGASASICISVFSVHSESMHKNTIDWIYLHMDNGGTLFGCSMLAWLSGLLRCTACVCENIFCLHFFPLLFLVFFLCVSSICFDWRNERGTSRCVCVCVEFEFEEKIERNLWTMLNEITRNAKREWAKNWAIWHMHKFYLSTNWTDIHCTRIGLDMVRCGAFCKLCLLEHLFITENRVPRFQEYDRYHCCYSSIIFTWVIHTQWVGENKKTDCKRRKIPGVRLKQRERERKS